MNSTYTTVYPQIADHLAEQLPGIGWIDLDQDQLQQPGDEYALPYDAGVILISFDEVQWEDLGRGVQRGEAEIRITLAMQVMQDAYQHSSQRAAALQKLELLGAIHSALQHFAGDGRSFGAMVRTGSRKEAADRPGLWVYSQIYKCRLSDETGHRGGTRVATDIDPHPRGEIGPVVSLR